VHGIRFTERQYHLEYTMEIDSVAQLPDINGAVWTSSDGPNTVLTKLWALAKYAATKQSKEQKPPHADLEWKLTLNLTKEQLVALRSDWDELEKRLVLGKIYGNSSRPRSPVNIPDRTLT